MTVKIETNKRGVEEIVGENLRGQRHVIEANRIYVQAATGHVLLAPLSERHNLVRLNPHEIPMIEYWERERGAGIEPKIFAGEAPPDGD